MNRRAFVGGLTAALAALSLPVSLLRSEGPPKLWGDGIHDDSAALQWYIDHSVPIPTSAAEYRVTKTLHIGPTGRMESVGSTFHADRGVDPIIRLHGPDNLGRCGNVYLTR